MRRAEFALDPDGILMLVVDRDEEHALFIGGVARLINESHSESNRRSTIGP